MDQGWVREDDWRWEGGDAYAYAWERSELPAVSEEASSGVRQGEQRGGGHTRLLRDMSVHRRGERLLLDHPLKGR